MTIDGRAIDMTAPPYVIAEISANHQGSKAHALELVAAAHDAGADAVKFQHYTPDTITAHSEHSDFRVGGGTLWDGRTLAELYTEGMTPWDWTEELVHEATRLGITWFSSPFDRTAVDFLCEFGVPAFKIASFEVIDLPLIRYAMSKGKPLILSTGMATVGEIDAAVRATREGRDASIALLKCNSGYPADPNEMNLRAIPVMSELWRCPVGLSDHTIGSTSAIAAVALGACIIEKHLTLRRSDGGPDGAFSAEPDELAAMVTAVRDAHTALGEASFGPTAREMPSLAFRRSIRAVRAIVAGERFTEENVRSIRPAGGLPPDEVGNVVGQIAARSLAQGDPIMWSDVEAAPAEATRR